MSETATYPTETESRIATPETSVETSQAFPRLDGELMPLVVANAEVIVPCSWMGGAEVTLAVAMMNYPRQMTEAIAGEIIAEVHAMLANRVLEKDKLENEEEKPQADEALQRQENEKSEEAPAKIEKEEPKPDQKAKTERPKPNAKEADKPAKAESEMAEPPEQIQSEEVAVAEKAVPASPAQNQTARPVPAPAKTEITARAETVAHSSKTSAETPSLISSNVPEAVAVASTASEISAMETVSHETAAPAIESSSSPDKVELVAEGSIETFTSSETAKVEDELELQEAEILDLQDPDILENVADLPDETEIAQEDLEATMPNYEMIEADLIDLAEPAEILIEHQAEDAFQFDEQLGELVAMPETEETVVSQLDEVEPPEQIEKDTPEDLVQIELKIEEIEDSLIQIVERIEASEPQTAESANQTLDKIAELTTKLEQQSGEEVITEAEAQKELEGLFIELFDQLGIEYTPELIQSLARLTLQRHLAGHTKNLDTEEEADDMQQDEGTHEVIKKLLAGSGNIKAMENVYAIGKLAIRPYTYDFPTELRKRLAA